MKHDNCYTRTGCSSFKQYVLSYSWDCITHGYASCGQCNPSLVSLAFRMQGKLVFDYLLPVCLLIPNSGARTRATHLLLFFFLLFAFLFAFWVRQPPPTPRARVPLVSVSVI